MKKTGGNHEVAQFLGTVNVHLSSFECRVGAMGPSLYFAGPTVTTSCEENTAASEYVEDALGEVTNRGTHGMDEADYAACDE